MTRTSTSFSFPNGRGQVLSGTLDAPEENPAFYGVFAPCFTCPKESHGAGKICRALAERGIAMLRFDMTGLGASEGDFAETNFTTRIQDIQAACRALEEAHAAPALLIGHSISGTAALSAARELPSVRLLATVGSPRDPTAVIDKFRRGGLMVLTEDAVELDVLGRKTMFRRSFLDDMLAQNVAADTAALACKLLVFHAPHDDIVSFDNAQEIYDRANGEKEFISLDPAATHLFEKRKEDAVFIAETIAARLRALSAP